MSTCSQSPSAQNNPCAKGAYFGMAYSAILQDFFDIAIQEVYFFIL